MKTIISIVLSANFGFVVLAHAQATPQDKMDIAGVRIGMTEAEARAALEAFDPELEITSVEGVFQYSDGVSYTLETPEFLDRLEGSIGNQGASFKVYFSGPVEDVRVIGVSRSGLIQTNPPTAQQFTQSLVDKYGQPAGLSGGNTSHPVWESAGKPSCIKARDYKNEVVINLNPGLGESLLTNSNAEEFFSKRGESTVARGLLPSDLAQCGAYVSYYYAGDPVRSFSAELYDVGAVVVTERSRSAWVEQLQTEAVRKREGQGQTPRL